jgi:hypothetical protein
MEEETLLKPVTFVAIRKRPKKKKREKERRWTEM